MNIKAIFVATVALTLGLTACNKEELLLQDNLPENAVRITASVGTPFEATRSMPLGTAEEQAKFESGDRMVVGNLKENSGASYLFDGSTWNRTSHYNLLWINDKQSFSAYYPVTGSDYGKKTVELDQSVLHKIDFSDLMYGELIDVPKGETLNFVMQRQTSRIIVKVGGFTPEFSNDSKVTDVKIAVKYATYSNYYTPYVQGEEGENRTYTLLADNDMRSNKVNLYVSLKVDEKEVHSNYLPAMESGKSYTYNLIVSKEILEIESVTVADWSTTNILPGGKFKEEELYYVPEMGTLAAVLGDKKATISKMTLRGEINKADFNVMKYEMPALTYLNLSQVTCEDNKIPDNAIGDNFKEAANQIIETIILPESVTVIGRNAFARCFGLNCELNLPTNLETIEYGAFDQCTSLSGPLTIPSKVSTIEGGAFSVCSGFTSLEFQNGSELKTIEESTFSGCSGFSGDVIFPNSLEAINQYAFSGCANVEVFHFKNSIPFAYTSNMLPEGTTLQVPVGTLTIYKSKDGWKNHPIVAPFIGDILNVPNKGALSHYLSISGLDRNSITHLQITGEINQYDFSTIKSEMNNLIYLDLSKVTSYEGTTINKIPDNAFGNLLEKYANKKIKFVILPERITAIGSYAFANCSGLDGVLNLPDALETIGSAAFNKCVGLVGDLVIPNKVSTIGSSAFSGCTGFDGYLSLSTALESIGSSAFYECVGLVGDLVIPNKVNTIGSNAFSGCAGFDGYLSLSTALESIAGGVFSRCTSLTGNLTIPGAVETLGHNAFSRCNFTSLTLLEGLRTIDYNTFDRCSNISETVVFPSTLTAIGEKAFGSSNKIPAFQFLNSTPLDYTNQMFDQNIPVKVPTGTVGAYKSQWGANATRHTITD